MSTLNEIVAQVAVDLKDPAHAVWSAEELARAAGWALQELSRAVPLRGMAVLPTQAGVREYSLGAAGLASILFIAEVWYPSTPAGPGCSPQLVPWRLLDGDTLCLDVEAVYAGEGVRVLYARPHTIEGLDGAASSTLGAEQKGLVCLGAAGQAALQRALQAIGQVNLAGEAPRLWREWGERRLFEFRTRLNQLARQGMHWRGGWAGGWG